jgi:SAM-dependent methyltransferase
MEQLAADPQTAMLVDRRSRYVAEAARSGGLAVRAQWRLPGLIGPDAVHAALLAPLETTPGFVFPRRIETISVAYNRLVDRFYVPDDPGPELSSALFNLIARDYDRLTKLEVNRAISCQLLKSVGADQDHRNLRILDFGCGTGIAVAASRDLKISNHIELVGTDAAPSMLLLAGQHGEMTIPLDEWRALPAASFDGAIAAFVLHYGVPLEDLAHIARQLKEGSRFAANYFKPRPEAIGTLTEKLSGCGLVLQRHDALHSTNGENTMLIFAKAVGKSA